MKRNVIFSEYCGLYKKWESRNALFYENGKDLWDIYVNERPVTKGSKYNVLRIKLLIYHPNFCGCVVWDNTYVQAFCL